VMYWKYLVALEIRRRWAALTDLAPMVFGLKLRLGHLQLLGHEGSGEGVRPHRGARNDHSVCAENKPLREEGPDFITWQGGTWGEEEGALAVVEFKPQELLSKPRELS